MAPALNVVSYHINVAAGDSAIHVLEGPKSDTDTTIICHHAVLIDGGRQCSATGTPLQATIAKLQTHYGVFQFDAIVITHWDTDHFAGIVNLLCRGFSAQYNNAATPKPSDKDVMGWKSRYLKYGPGGELLSTLYAPYWADKGGTVPGNLFGNKEPAGKLIARKAPGGYVIDVALGLMPPLVAMNVCNLCCSSSKYIGRELFSGASLGSGFGSPNALRLAYNKLNIPLSVSPGLFIIGGNTTSIIQKPNKTNMAFQIMHTPDGRVFLIPSQIPPFPTLLLRSLTYPAH